MAAKITCPECRGPLHAERQDRITEYRCRVGHAYFPLALLQDHNSALERALWAAVLALEESAEIAKRLCTEKGNHAAALRLAQADGLRTMLAELHSG